MIATSSITKHGSDAGLRLGLDAGTLFVHFVLLDGNDLVVARQDALHGGEVLATARRMMTAWTRVSTISAVGVVGSNARPIAEALGLKLDDQIGATLRGLRAQFPDVRQVIDAGGSSLSLIRLNEDGSFAEYQTNTLCAAGTGSFLDEQSERLGLRYEDMEDLPTVLAPPNIAARCAVFAKSDLIHRQQEGYSPVQCWAGLCRGLARTMVMTLFKGRAAKPPVALVGGVAQNREVVRGLQAEMGIHLLIPEQPESCTAHGAALSARSLSNPLDPESLVSFDRGEILTKRRRALDLKRSHYPSFEADESWVNAEGTEVRILAWPNDDRLSGWLGVDIGSTSTKAVLLNEQDQVILDLYRRTAGDPITATRLLLSAIQDLAKQRDATVEIRGVGTTGSGRKLVGAVFGADRVCNEITAHLTAAIRVDPTIETIFEIGGQDAKYVHASNGRLSAANMNHVCAAGTGSFVEELARKLGFDLHTLGDQLLGVRSPVTSDRCTVFMEQDARRLLHQGFSPREVMASVICSVVQNYLTRVVGHRPLSRKRIFFQGATARNKALVAAFEQLLDVEVVVSPLCHVMGAWGVALLTKQQLGSTITTEFHGFDLLGLEVELETHNCALCSNRCTITSARSDAATVSASWGYLCDRDPREKRVRTNPGFGAIKARNRLWKSVGRVKLPPGAPEIAMPRALLSWQYAPFWRRLLGELGYRLRLSGPTDEATIRAASDWVGADYCFPVKLAHGHVQRLLMEPPPLGVAGTGAQVLLPFMISEKEVDADGHTARAWFCPYNIGLPAMLGAAARLRGADAARLLEVTLDLRWDDDTAARRLHRDLGGSLGKNRRAFRRAWKKATESQRQFESDLLELGQIWLDRIRKASAPAVVVMGRPYNLYDAGANLSLPEKLSRLGITLLPMDLLPFDNELLGREFANMYWNFGRRILAATRYVARTPGVYALGLTSFGCGPDSFVWTYVEKLMGDKPLLVLELDEHGADAGYLTRLEAFADVLQENPATTVAPFRLCKPSPAPGSRDGWTLWIPPIHEAASTLAAAALRHAGVAARPLPEEDTQAFVKGRCHTRGGECLPCPATIGTYLKTIEREGGDPQRHGLFMPTAEGPCRFGQYCTLDRIILEELGWDPVHILSWSSSDTYAGLSRKGRRRFWTALVLGDLLFKMRCRVAPYESEPGRTDNTFRVWTERLEKGLEQGEQLEPLIEGALQAFLIIPQRYARRPLVGIVGEVYVRHNRFSNQDLVRTIEREGGEAWLAPLSEWVLYIGYLDSHGLGNSPPGLRARLAARLRNGFLVHDEHRWLQLAGPLLAERREPSIERILQAGSRFVPLDFVGETILTLGRAMIFAREGAALVVNCAPFGCMPGAMTAGVLQQLEAETGVPMLSLTYDGERSGVNDRLATYLSNLRSKHTAYPAIKHQP